jgi:chitodextrinase
MKRLFIFALILSAFAVGVSSCKAWRTISTSATYVQQNDTSKTTTTISTKTIEEYTGVKK